MHPSMISPLLSHCAGGLWVQHGVSLQPLARVFVCPQHWRKSGVGHRERVCGMLRTFCCRWQCDCCPAVREPKYHLDDVVITTFFECKRDSFIFDHQTNASDYEIRLLSLWLVFVCGRPGVNFNNLPWAALSLCMMSVGLQVISMTTVGGSQCGPL